MKFDDVEIKKITPDYLFARGQDEQVGFSEDDLIELVPYGMSLNNDTTNPFLLLRDKSGQYTLPVGISQIEAGVALTQSGKNAYATPHVFTEKILKSLDITLERCLFVEINGSHQYVRLYMKNHPRYQSIKVKASDVMSICLHLSVPFFATASFIQKSKVMTIEPSAEEKALLSQMDFSDHKKNCH